MDNNKSEEKFLNQWDNPVYKYEVVESKENPNESLILKTGIMSKFSINNIIQDVEYLKKRKIEFEAQIDLEKSKIDNVVNHYQDVPVMDEKLRIACSIYQISNETAKRYQEQLDIVNKQLDEEAKQLDEIKLQTGLAPDEIKPEELEKDGN